MSVEAKVLNLLQAGMTQEQVAVHLKISAGYVSQIANQQEIKTKVLTAHVRLLDEATQRDQNYNELEDLLLAKMKGAMASIYKPQDILRSLMLINKAERRGATSQQIAEIANQRNESVVELELPERMKTKFVKSHTKEVIEVNGRALISKDSRQLYAEIMQEGGNDGTDGFDGIDVELPELGVTGEASSIEENNVKQLPGPSTKTETENLFDSLFSRDSSPVKGNGV